MISYRLEIADAHAHLFRVTLTVPKPAEQQALSLPVWIPGSYLVREFARHLSGLAARQGSRDVPLRQLDKASWVADCQGQAALSVSYLVYAYDTSVRAAFLDANRGFFNGTGVFLRVHGREDEPHELELRGLPKLWEVATALNPVKVDARGQGRYEAADYDELVDHPVELGRFWRGSFKAAGVTHQFVVAGALPDFDGERLLADTQRICEAEIKFWHGHAVVDPAVGKASKAAGKTGKATKGSKAAAKEGKVADSKAVAATTKPGKPFFKRYVFMLNCVEDGYGGLEHRASTALIASRRDLPQRGRQELNDGYVTLLGLISHEYFHTWNVKQLRPSEFRRYDYTQENYTELLWFFEGFTSYYDDLLLRRAGLIDEPRYLRLLAKTVTGVLGMPGRKVQSVAQSSFDAWVKYYRTDENTPNSTISYYTKGSLVALALDLTLRSEGKGTLDDVMRLLWVRSSGGPISEANIAAALKDIGGRSYQPELRAWVHGTDDLPLRNLLAKFGIQWKPQQPTIAQRLGLRASESALTGIKVSAVLRGGAAEVAGLSAGDEVLAVNDWRIRRLDDLPRLLPKEGGIELLAVRDQRLMRFDLQLPPAPETGAIHLEASTDPQQPKAAPALRQAWQAS